MRALLPLSLAVLVAGCNHAKHDTSQTTSASASAAAVLAPTASASSAAAAKPSPCTVEAAVTVDTGVRADAGITLVELQDGRIALGYATGNGEPKVAIVDAAGRASFPDVEKQHLDGAEKKKDPKTRRAILRVTPLGFMPGGMKMRVGVDMVDTFPDKSTYTRCGAADTAPLLMQGGPDDNGTGDEGRLVDCRTFSNGHKEWVLASMISISGAMEGKLPMRWVVDYQGKHPIDDVVLDEKMYDDKTLQKPEPWSFQVPVGIGVKDTGYVFASRQGGALVLARRDAHLQKQGEAARFGLGPAAPTMTALAALDHQAALFVGLYGKTDVLGTTFAIEAKPQKPEKLALDDPNPPTEGDRNSLTASYTPKGDIFLAFADGPATSKKARMTVLGGDLKSKVPVFDVAPSGSELRVVATGDEKALVTYLAGNAIQTATVSCKY